MKSDRDRPRDAAPLLAILAVYAVVAALLFPWTRWYVNPDGISYLQVARRIVARDWAAAANSYWSPLLSWLVAPLLALHVEPLVAARVVLYGSGAVAVVAFWGLASFFCVTRAARIAATAAFMPMALAFASTVITPDLLLLAAVLAYLALERGVARGGRRAALMGATAGVAYLAKAYALPFFFAHLGATSALRWVRSDREARKSIAKSFVIASASCLAVALPWIVVISISAGHPTVSTAGRYNALLLGPAVHGVHPMLTAGLLEPRDAQAVSIWDDPSRIEMPPLPRGRAWIAHEIGVAGRNGRRLVRAVWRVAPGAWFVLPLALWFIWKSGDRRRRQLLLWACFTAALFGGGYLPLIVEGRYVWIIPTLALLLSATLLEMLSEQRPARHVALVIAAIVFASFPLRMIRLLAGVPRAEMKWREEARALEASGIRLNAARLASDGEWNESLYLAYATHAQYLGIVRKSSDPVAVRRDLDAHRVDAFISWSGNTPAASLQGFTMVSLAGEPFVVYVRPRPGSRASSRVQLTSGVRGSIAGPAISNGRPDVSPHKRIRYTRLIPFVPGPGNSRDRSREARALPRRSCASAAARWRKHHRHRAARGALAHCVHRLGDRRRRIQ